MAMAMPFRPFFLNPRTRVGDLQVLSASKRPKYPDGFVKIFFNPKIPFANLVGYLSKSSVHQFESIAKNLTPVGLERIVVHVHWGAVERDGRQYHWAGYRELLCLARSFGLKVKVVLGFHHHYCEGIDKRIPLPKWVLKAMERNGMHFRNRVGAKSVDYISFECDDLPLLEGRSPTDVYSDFMKSFVNTFSSLLGHTVTDIEIGLGPNGELRFPYFMNRCWDSMSVAKYDFACFDRHMLQGTYRSEVLRSLDKKDLPALEGFLKRYSKALIVHGDKVLQKVMPLFSKSSVNVSGRLASMYWGPYIMKDCELMAGYVDYIAIMEMISKNECGMQAGLRRL